MKWSIGNIVGMVINVLMIPIHFILAPIDMFLDQLPGIKVVPDSISAITGLIGSLPSTMVNLIGLSPILWNILFTSFVLFVTLVPAINALKKVWAWIRP